MNSRIAILDGFRALAVLAVMLFHFCCRYVPPRHETSLYPYQDQFDYFGYGRLGVQFFFIISGFVIFSTLDNTSNFSEFWKKRLIRLIPSIVIASLLTYGIFELFDNSYLFEYSHHEKNFFPSLTFITPALFNKLFPGGAPFYYINGSYWSLWLEIQFYLVASLLYYLNRKRFIRNFLLISFALISVNWIFNHIQGSNRLNINLPAETIATYSVWVTDMFNLADYLPFFCIGVLFYVVFKNRQLNQSGFSVKLLLTGLMFFQLYSGVQMEAKVIYMMMFLLFFGFIYYPQKLKFFERGLITRIGVCSYFLYLIHENIGVLLINSLGEHFLPLGFIFPVLVIALLIFFSILFTEKVDSKITVLLKNNLLKKGPRLQPATRTIGGKKCKTTVLK